MQADSIEPSLVPRVGMEFRCLDDCYDFYLEYARAVGFSIKRYRSDGNIKWLNCRSEGTNPGKAKKEDAKGRKTGTVRTGCKAGLKLRQIVNEKKEVVAVRIVLANLDHNHKFLTEKEAAKHFYSHKQVESPLLDFVGALQDSRVPEHCIIDIVSDMNGGPENNPMTRQDLKNM